MVRIAYTQGESEAKYDQGFKIGNNNKNVSPFNMCYETQSIYLWLNLSDTEV